ncbi:MAG: amidohydrolase [Theionarchaea archaeon]|nr:amidohydrolase [Theionarchaea archaeon]
MTSAISAQVLKSRTFQEPWDADMVLVNGDILTVDSTDSVQEAVAVKDGIIGEVGTNDEISERIGRSTEVVDLKGKAATPGIIDSHLHLMIYGEQDLLYVNLRPPVTSIRDIQQVVKEAASKTPKGEWIEGYGYIMNLEEGKLPEKYELDPVSPDNPVFLTSMDGHYGSCNQYALDEAGIDANFPDPPTGGVIVRDKNRNPTGLFYNHIAMNLVRRLIPKHTTEEYKKCLFYAYEDHIAAGITSYHAALVAGEERYNAYKEIDLQSEMRASIYYMSETLKDVDHAVNTIKPFSGKMVRFAGWKLQTDGTFLTAYTYNPHNGVTHTMANWTSKNLKEGILQLHKTGYQVKVHVVGDKAIDMTLDAIEYAVKSAPRKDPRHRLEHLIIPTDDALKRIAQNNIVVSYQPAMIYFGGEEAINLYGEERAQRFVRLRTLLDMGVTVCINTDSPTSKTYKPQLTLYSAVTRKTLRGMDFFPKEKISIQEALRCYTINGAYASFEDDIKGSIEKGKLADFVIWSHNMYKIRPERLLRMEAEMTIIGGVIKYRKDGTRITVHKGTQ